jgi:drug/metabolite transporter (DMT)-like permease
VSRSTWSDDLLLIAACFLWGVSFVVVKDALAVATPLAFVTLRFGLAAVVLAPFARLRAPFTRGELGAGALLGVLLGAGFIAHTAGLVPPSPCASGRTSCWSGRFSSPPSARTCSRPRTQAA